MKKVIVALVIGALTVSVAVSSAVAKPTKKSASADICVLLPDPKSSVRWETQDRPALVAAFKKAGASYVITNADGDAQKQKTQADQCLANGAKVVILVSLDKGSSIAIEAAAKSRDAKVIEYDRQVVRRHCRDLHLLRRSSSRRPAGQGCRRRPQEERDVQQEAGRRRAERRPDRQQLVPVQGRLDSVLKPLYKNGTFKKGPDQFTPGWDNQKAGTIFEQMLVKTSNKIDAVAAANDGLANAVVVALKAHKLKPVPLSGQDATEQGVQNIISGWQTMTVWKDTRKLATASAKRPSPSQGSDADRRPAQ